MTQEMAAMDDYRRVDDFHLHNLERIDKYIEGNNSVFRELGASTRLERSPG